MGSLPSLASPHRPPWMDGQSPRTDLAACFFLLLVKLVVDGAGEDVRALAGLGFMVGRRGRCERDWGV